MYGKFIYYVKIKNPIAKIHINKASTSSNKSLLSDTSRYEDNDKIAIQKINVDIVVVVPFRSFK